MSIQITKCLCVSSSQDLVTRICFVLGNLAALDEESRLALYQEKDSMQALMNVFEHYLQLSFKVLTGLTVGECFGTIRAAF